MSELKNNPTSSNSEQYLAERISYRIDKEKKYKDDALFILSICWHEFRLWKTMLNIFIYLLANKWKPISIGEIIEFWTWNLESEENTIAKNIEKFNKSVWRIFPEYTINNQRGVWYQVWFHKFKEIFSMKTQNIIVRFLRNWKYFRVYINNEIIWNFELSAKLSNFFEDLLKYGCILPNRMIASRIKTQLRHAWLDKIIRIEKADWELFYRIVIDIEAILVTNMRVINILKQAA